MNGYGYGMRYGVIEEHTFFVNDSTKPYDFQKRKTPEEEFRRQVKEMDAKTKMDTKLDENEIRERRKKRLDEMQACME